MFKKFKKPEKIVEPKKYYFLEKDIPNFYKHYDEATKNNTYLTKYYLWKFIYKKLNLDADIHYQINIDDVITPYIIEQTKK